MELTRKSYAYRREMIRMASELEKLSRPYPHTDAGALERWRISIARPALERFEEFMQKNEKRPRENTKEY